MADVVLTPEQIAAQEAFAKKYGIKPPPAPPPAAAAPAERPASGWDAIRQGLQVEALRRRERAGGT